MVIKGASGLGDSIYLYPLVKHFMAAGEPVTVMTDYPDIFSTLHVKTMPHTKDFAEQKLSYCPRKHIPETNQYQDVCIAAGLSKYPELQIDWNTRSKALIHTIRKISEHRKLCMVVTPHDPFGRADHFGKELTIDYGAMQKIIDAMKHDYFFVMCGSGACIYSLKCINLNLHDNTSITDLFDIANESKVILCQVGHGIPLGECLGKRVVSIYSRKGLNSQNKFISTITPKKVASKLSTFSVVDDEINDEKISEIWRHIT